MLVCSSIISSFTAAVCTPKSSLHIDQSPDNARPIGRNSAKQSAKTLELETRRVVALEKIAAASEGKLQLYKEYAEALRQENLIKLATIKVEELDEISARLVTLQKQKMLAALENDTEEIREEMADVEFLDEDIEVDEHSLRDTQDAWNDFPE